MVMLALFVLEELLEPRLLQVRRPFKFLLLLACGAGVLFSFSRAAWLNAAVGVFAMLVVVALRRGGGSKAMGILVTLLVSLDRAGGLRLGHRLGELPQRAGAPAELRHLALQRAGDRAAARRGLSLRRRAGPVRVVRADVHAQRLHPRAGRAGRARAGDGVRAADDDADLRGQKRGPRTGHLRDRLGGLTRGLVRPDGQQRVRRHAALAPPVDRRGPDLGRRDEAAGAYAETRPRGSSSPIADDAAYE